MVCSVTPVPRKPWWLFPNLLSLDAPLVAVLWLTLFAKSWGVNYHPGHEYGVLALSVWTLYVVDRLLDSAVHGDSPRCQARHHFHRKHRWMFLTAAVLAGAAALRMILTKSPMALFSYLLVEGIVVAAFFALVMFRSAQVDEIPYTKNILAGVAFAFGTAMLAHVYLYDRSIRDLLFSREFMCFATLCILNISAIDLWEHADRCQDVEMKAADELALTLPLILLGTAAVIFAAQAELQSTREFYYAILTGAALLHILNQTRARFSIDSLRVLADAALVVSALVFF